MTCYQFLFTIGQHSWVFRSAGITEGYKREAYQEELPKKIITFAL